MKTLFILTLISLSAQAEYIDYGAQPLGRVTPGYGLGSSRDNTGRAYHYAPGALGAPSVHQAPGFIDYGAQPSGRITRDAYGLGTHKDAQGRAFHYAPGTLGR